MDKDIIYTENFNRIIYKNALVNLIQEFEEVYSSNSGWSVGPINVEKVDNERIRVTAELTKRAKDESVYKETFVKVIRKEEYNHFISSIYEQYTSDLGWTIGEPLINELNDEELIVRVPLTKQEKSRNL